MNVRDLTQSESTKEEILKDLGINYELLFFN